jgi:ATP/maltotriose-dependent transcriptional regulator MalT
LLAESLALRRARGDERGLAKVIATQAQVALHQRDLPAARAMLTDVLATVRRLDERWGHAQVLVSLGHVELVAGDLSRARECLVEAARLHADLGNPLYLSWCLEGLAGVVATQGRAADAARLCGARDALLERLGSGLPPADPASYAHTLANVRAALGESSFSTAHEAGRALSPEAIIAAVEGSP